VAHKGYAWFEVTTHGRAAHGSLPEEGRDAILMMGRVLGLLDALDRKLAQLPPHPRLGHASLHASLISGGQELSSYPAQCRLEIERRTLPGESDAQVEAELRGLLAGLEARDPEFRATARRLASRPAYEISPDAPVAVSAAEAIREVAGSVELSGMAAWTDTALLAAAGIPGVVFGPRGRGLHGAEEYVELDSVHTCAEVLQRLILRLCVG
jgi:acetylornithine deacetylase